MTTIIDVNAEAAELTMFRGRTPTTTFAARKGTAANLASYRDGLLLLTKFTGKGHWETHPADELVYVPRGQSDPGHRREGPVAILHGTLA